jgi:hypothetical protein
MSSLITGYYYSIQGDRYLQRKWSMLKYILQNRPALPAPAGSGNNAGKPAIGAPVKQAEKTAMAKTGKPEAPKPKIAPSKMKRAAKIAPNRSQENGTVEVKAVSVRRVIPAAAKPGGKEAVRPVLTRPAVKAAQLGRPVMHDRTEAARVRIKPESRPVDTVQARAATAGPENSGIRPKPKTVPVQRGTAQPELRPERDRVIKEPIPAPRTVEQQEPAGRPQPERPVSKPRLRKIASPPRLPDKPTGSVSDRLRELSGRSYDIYQDRFLAKARPAIRRVLGAGRGLFFTLSEEAEDLVYNFLQDHYSDPYMNWGGSPERTALSNLGYNLETLNPVIDECYRNL